MKVATLRFGHGEWRSEGDLVESPQLVIWFTAYSEAASPDAFDGLRRLFPDAAIAGCTTNGEIYLGDAMDGAAVAAAIRFDDTRIRTVSEVLSREDDARAGGLRLAQGLRGDDLKGVFVLTDAFGLNGPELVEGLMEGLPGVPISGGMAGDDATLCNSTRAGLNERPRDGAAVAIGFYGASVRIGYGVAGGWDELGPERRVTRSEGAIVYEFDGEPALEVYERLVGDAAGIARLRHPFAFKPDQDSAQDVIWEVVGIDRENKGIVFIDKVPQGWWGRMLRGIDDNLVEGAGLAARRAGMGAVAGDALSLVVSCIGRKWVMGQRIGDETEAVQEEAPRTPTIGFYSYGEIAPHAHTGRCTLHHASVSVTLLSEAA